MPFGTYRCGRRAATVWGMKILAAVVLFLLLAATPAQAADPDPPQVPATPGAWIAGVGHFTFKEPGTYDHRIRFSVAAGVDRRGKSYGVFRYKHQLPDGRVVGEGYAEVVCVSVQGNTALVAAVVPDGQGTVVNHGFYVKIIEGRPDHIESAQAGGDPTRPAPRYCVDPALFSAVRYPLDRGGFTFGR